VLFGRRELAGFPLAAREVNQCLCVFVTALLTLLTIAFGIRNHGNSHQAALSQVLYRLAALFLSLIGEIASLTFGLIALIWLAKESEPEVPDCFPQYCFSLHDRLVQSGLLVGLSILALLLTLLVAAHAVRALIHLLYDRRLERRIARRSTGAELASYTNPIAFKRDSYY